MTVRLHKFGTTHIIAFFLTISITLFGCLDNTKEELSMPREGKGGIVLGGTFNINQPEKPASLYPANIDNLFASNIVSQIYDGLIKYNPSNLELAPNVAASWSIDESETVYTFKIKKGIFFHEDISLGGHGRELNANDVKFSLELLCKSDENSKGYTAIMKDKVWGADEFFAGNSKEVTGIQVKDDYTLEIKLIHPNQSFLYALASPQASIIPKEAVKRYGKEAKVGSGPFVYREKGGYVVLERNKNYHRSDAFGNQLPYLDKVHVSFIPQKDRELEAFFNGELHLVSNLSLGPVRDIMDNRIGEFQGENAKYVLERTSEISFNEVYHLKASSLQGIQTNFMNYQDFSVVWLKKLRGS